MNQERNSMYYDDIQLLKEMIDEVVQKYEMKVIDLQTQILNPDDSYIIESDNEEVELLRSENERLKEQVNELKTQLNSYIIDSDNEEVELLRSEIERLKEQVNMVNSQSDVRSEDTDYQAPVVKLKSNLKPIRTQPRQSMESSNQTHPPEHNIESQPPTPQSDLSQSSITSMAISTDSHRKCPSCYNQKTTLIHETNDKSNIINVYPRIYGKKYRCGSCGGEWRIRENKVEILK